MSRVSSGAAVGPPSYTAQSSIEVRRPRAGSSEGMESVRLQDARVHAAEYSLDATAVAARASHALSGVLKKQAAVQSQALSATPGSASGLKRSSSAPDLPGRCLESSWVSPVLENPVDLMTSVAAQTPPFKPAEGAIPPPILPDSSVEARSDTGPSATGRGEGKLIIGMVGLPARGKTYLARKLKRHLSWLGLRTEIFNVGNVRRAQMAEAGKAAPADFFNPHNEEGMAARQAFAQAALHKMLKEVLGDLTDVAIFDATNSTRARRAWLRGAIAEAESQSGIPCRLVFVESICTDEDIIRSNIRETKLKSPDYKHMREEDAVRDFTARIQQYTKVYEMVEDAEEVPYIQLIDVGRKIIAHRMMGFLNSRILYFLSNISITPRPIWLTRHGESEFNVQGLIGGDSGLSHKGDRYSHALAAFIDEHYPPEVPLTVWTSTLKRTRATAKHLGRRIIQWKALDEISAGVCDAMSYEDIAATMPGEYAARAADKFHYRYPQGESYQDIVHRLEPVIIELMRQKGPVLVISHQATLRVLYAYLADIAPEACPKLAMPLHTLIQLTPKAYGVEEVRHELM